MSEMNMYEALEFTRAVIERMRKAGYNGALLDRFLDEAKEEAREETIERAKKSSEAETELDAYRDIIWEMARCLEGDPAAEALYAKGRAARKALEDRFAKLDKDK